MAQDLGKINAIRNMINSIKQQCMAYEQCKNQTHIVNNTMEDLCEYLKKLEAELERLDPRQP